MFEEPAAKRIKRSKLFSGYSSSSSSSSIVDDNEQLSNSQQPIQPDSKHTDHLTVAASDAELEDSDSAITTYHSGSALASVYGFEYQFVEIEHNTDSKATGDDLAVQTRRSNEGEDQPREQTFEFNLFKPSSKNLQTQANLRAGPNNTDDNSHEALTSASAAVPKQSLITIRSPTPERAHKPGSGSILKPRPHSHYLTSFLSTAIQNQLKAQYLDSALSGIQIELLSKQQWPGTHLPWRVIQLKQSKQPQQPQQPSLQPQPPSSTTSAQAINSNEDPCHQQQISLQKSRKRPSKKRRITRRKHAQFKLDQQIQIKLAHEKSEELLRLKKTQRNRDKKIKRKLKDKQKKKEQLQQQGVVEGNEIEIGMKMEMEMGNGDQNENGQEAIEDV